MNQDVNRVLPPDLRDACVSFEARRGLSLAKAEAAWERLKDACDRHCLDAGIIAKAARTGGYGATCAAARRQLAKPLLRRAMERTASPNAPEPGPGRSLADRAASA